MIFRSEFLCLCRVECDRRRTAKLIHPSSNGRSFGRTYILKTLSGQMGVTTLDDGKTQSFGPFAGKRPIQLNSLVKISSGTPTFRSLLGVFGGSYRPLYQERSI